MFCPNCKQEYDGKFCPECGTKLIEKPATLSGGIIVNLGDANAISGGIHMQDRHDVTNIDNSVHNITNNTSTVNNITNVAAQKTEIEVLQERKLLYLNACKRAYEDNVLEQSEKIELDRLRMELGLDEATADEILDQVRQIVMRNAQKTELTGLAKIKLKQLSDALKKNEVQAIMRQIDSLEALAGKFTNDELQYKYYLVLSALRHEKCIEKFESSKVDNYWKSFWSYFAFLKAQENEKASDILYSLGDKFPNYPEDNIALLAAAGSFILNDKETAQDYLTTIGGDYSPALQRFVETIYLLLDPDTAKEMGATEQSCAFYLINIIQATQDLNVAVHKKQTFAENVQQAVEEQEKYKKLNEIYVLGDDFFHGTNGKTQNYTEAIKWYRMAAEQGFSLAQFSLGVCFDEGKGTTPNKTEAAKWYRMSAEQGNADAQHNLGWAYYYGEGVTQDIKEAVKWFLKAAEQGVANSQYCLGYCYYNGEGVTQNYEEAVKWWRKAAEQGNVDSIANLGDCYYLGEGVKQNYSEAVKWLQKAADEEDDGFAKKRLGECFYFGRGVKKNTKVAQEYWNLAAEQGDEDAIENLKKYFS